MIAWYPAIGAEALPSDFMLRQLGHAAVPCLFQLMIFSALLESGVSCVHAVNERIAGYLAERSQRAFRRSRALRHARVCWSARSSSPRASAWSI